MKSKNLLNVSATYLFGVFLASPFAIADDTKKNDTFNAARINFSSSRKIDTNKFYPMLNTLTLRGGHIGQSIAEKITSGINKSFYIFNDGRHKSDSSRTRIETINPEFSSLYDDYAPFIVWPETLIPNSASYNPQQLADYEASILAHEHDHTQMSLEVYNEIAAENASRKSPLLKKVYSQIIDARADLIFEVNTYQNSWLEYSKTHPENGFLLAVSYFYLEARAYLLQAKLADNGMSIPGLQGDTQWNSPEIKTYLAKHIDTNYMHDLSLGTELREALIDLAANNMEIRGFWSQVTKDRKLLALFKKALKNKY